jgi:hypothetical protein
MDDSLLINRYIVAENVIYYTDEYTPSGNYIRCKCYERNSFTRRVLQLSLGVNFFGDFSIPAGLDRDDLNGCPDNVRHFMEYCEVEPHIYQSYGILKRFHIRTINDLIDDCIKFISPNAYGSLTDIILYLYEDYNDKKNNCDAGQQN